tara:strand:- start:25 stop:1053 length:1029 start_codon:yes stop_codon:yes gene_type:complete
MTFRSALSKSRTLIIAEAGVNHNGDVTTGKKLINIAVEANADIIKFQSFNANQLSTSGAEKAQYQKQMAADKQNQLEMLKGYQLSEKDHDELMQHCDQMGIEFLSSAFDIESLNMLISKGQKRIKIPSGEITNFPLLNEIGKINKQTFMSTGMATHDEVEAALKVLEDAGLNKNNIVIMHCNTEYPTPIADVNLRAMVAMKNDFSVDIGYSDHTNGFEVSICAVTLGAKVIEKHITLDKSSSGPDHAASMEPNEFVRFIEKIREVELALGDGIKRPSKSEQKNINVVRRSIVASKKIYQGELFTQDNITTKRPGTGISPIHWDNIIGQVANHDFDVDDLIET